MTTRCPYCFVDLDGPLVAFRCEAPQCASEPDEIASGFGGGPVASRPVTVVHLHPELRGIRPVVAPCCACDADASLVVCPRCHTPLPSGWYQCVTTCVALAGARASGKSIYIGVLKRQAELLAAAMGTSLEFFDAATEQTYLTVYQRPLYEQRGLVAATARHESTDATQRVPLIFTMGMVGDRPHMVVIRDVAGENLEDPSSDPKIFSFFQHADGIIFLFDPMRVEEIRQHLVGVVPEQQAVGGDPQAVLGNLARLARTDAHSSCTPLAVALAKFDTLYELRNVAGSPWAPVMRNVGAAYSRDPSLNAPEYDDVDGALLDAEVRSLLIRMNAQTLLNRVDADFTTSRLFAVSALGAAPVGQALQARGITPFRCLDPLKWIISAAHRPTSA